MAYEKIDEGSEKDTFNKLITEILEFSALEEIDIKRRLKLEKDISNTYNRHGPEWVLNLFIKVLEANRLYYLNNNR